MQARLFRLERGDAARVMRRVGDPDRLAGLPDHSGKPHAGLERGIGGALARARRGFHSGSRPALEGTQQRRGLVDTPEIGAVPTFAFGDAAQHRAHRLDDVGRLGHHARDGMLELQQLLDALFLGDVAPDPQVAAEPAVLVEQRLRAEG